MFAAARSCRSCSVTYPCASDSSAGCLDSGGGCPLGIRSILFDSDCAVKAAVLRSTARLENGAGQCSALKCVMKKKGAEKKTVQFSTGFLLSNSSLAFAKTAVFCFVLVCFFFGVRPCVLHAVVPPQEEGNPLGGALGKWGRTERRVK